jgi:hypothetical protein
VDGKERSTVWLLTLTHSLLRKVASKYLSCLMVDAVKQTHIRCDTYVHPSNVAQAAKRSLHTVEERFTSPLSCSALICGIGFSSSRATLCLSIRPLLQMSVGRSDDPLCSGPLDATGTIISDPASHLDATDLPGLRLHTLLGRLESVTCTDLQLIQCCPSRPRTQPQPKLSLFKQPFGRSPSSIVLHASPPLPDTNGSLDKLCS